MKSRGLVVVELSKEERAAFRAEVENASPKLRALLGPPELHDEATTYRDEYRKARAR